MKKRATFTGDENKKQLLDLGAGEALLKLMQSEDRIVRRNACMALGVMTANRKYLFSWGISLYG